MANAAPTATFVVKCASGLCTFDASGSADPDGTITSYEWTFGDGTTLDQPAGSATATHGYRTGTFTVQLVVRDNAGASATASATVQTMNNPPHGIVRQNLRRCSLHLQRVCVGDPEGRALQYNLWDFGDASGTNGTAIQQHTSRARHTESSSRSLMTSASGPLESTITVQPGSLHVGDLDGTSTQGEGTVDCQRDGRGPRRRAPAGRVCGFWGRWSSGDASACTTDATGQCTLSTALKGTGGTFTIQSVERVAYVYGGTNHDPDGDSNGTTITVKR